MAGIAVRPPALTQKGQFRSLGCLMLSPQPGSGPRLRYARSPPASNYVLVTRRPQCWR